MMDIETAKKLRNKIVTFEVGPHRQKIKQARIDSVSKDGEILFFATFDHPRQFVLTSEITAYMVYEPGKRIELK